MAKRKPPPAAAVAEALENADLLDAPAGLLANAVTSVVAEGRACATRSPAGRSVTPCIPCSPMLPWGPG